MRTRLLPLALAVLLGGNAARAAAPTVVAGPGPADPDALFEARCADADSAECAAARGLLLELMIRDLDVLERSHDRRAVETARLLLDTDEPELQAGALRILARWAKPPTRPRPTGSAAPPPSSAGGAP